MKHLLNTEFKDGVIKELRTDDIIKNGCGTEAAGLRKLPIGKTQTSRRE